MTASGAQEGSVQGPIRRVGTEALTLVALAAGVLLGTGLGSPGPSAVTLKLGPNAGPYLRGFAPSYEVEGTQATRWSGTDATVGLPLVLGSGPAEVAYRFARVLPQTAVVEVTLAGQTVDHFSCRGGRIELRRVPLAALPAAPLDLRFQVDSHDRRGLGLRFDWVQLRLGSGGRLVVAWGPRLLCVLLVLGCYLLWRFVGHGPLAAGLLAGVLAAAAVLAARGDPFGFARVTDAVALPGLALFALAALVLRRVPAGRWVLAILVAGYLVKGAGVFHPTSYYPDFLNARRYILALADTQGSLADRTLAAQVATNVAYPRFVAGKAYAFPYSPLLFLPFIGLSGPDAMEDAFRLLGLMMAALECLLVFWLARLAAAAGQPRAPAQGTPVAGAAAALVAAVLPPPHSRLLLGMSATLTGHAIDCALIAAVLLLLVRPQSGRRLLAVGGLAFASLASYVSSLFTVSAFLLMAALLARRLAVRLLAVLAGAGLLVVFWLYAPFLWTFLTEILPAVAHGHAMASQSGATAPGGPGFALSRVLIFYGPVYPLLTVAGFVLLRRTADPRVFRGFLAVALAFLLLLGLRAFGGGLFRDLKEISFVGPLVAVASGIVIEALACQGRRQAIAAGLLALGLVVYGLGRYHDYLVSYASPFLVAQDANPPGPSGQR